MDKATISKNKWDYLRILCILPIAWIAYNIVASLIFEYSTKKVINEIGINVWRYGIDIILFLVFCSAGILMAPKKIKWSASIIIFINYVIAYIWSYIWLTKFFSIYVDYFINNRVAHLTMNYVVLFIPMLISVVILFKMFENKEKANNS